MAANGNSSKNETTENAAEGHPLHQRDHYHPLHHHHGGHCRCCRSPLRHCCLVTTAVVVVVVDHCCRGPPSLWAAIVLSTTVLSVVVVAAVVVDAIVLSAAFLSAIVVACGCHCRGCHHYCHCLPLPLHACLQRYYKPPLPLQSEVLPVCFISDPRHLAYLVFFKIKELQDPVRSFTIILKLLNLPLLPPLQRIW